MAPMAAAGARQYQRQTYSETGRRGRQSGLNITLLLLTWYFVGGSEADQRLGPWLA